MTLPQSKFKILFLGSFSVSDSELKNFPNIKKTIYQNQQALEVEVDPQQYPYAQVGELGSILDIALGNLIDIDHACGGVLACSTCHVKILKGMNSCNEASDEEYDMLDKAPNSNLKSRLSCQCVILRTDEELVVEIPKWNRNLARESH